MEEKESSRIWENLKHAIHQIQRHNASSLSFEELYRSAYNLVMGNCGELLYNGVHDVIAEHLKSVAQKCVECSDDRLLEELNAQWDDHKTIMNMIKGILMYMAKNYVAKNKRVPIYEMGLIIFREDVCGHQRVKTRLLTSLLKSIAIERRGDHVDRFFMKHTIDMLVDLGVQNKCFYRELFEDQFLDQSRKFYRDESMQYISTSTCSDYLKKAEARMQEEKVRVEHYLHAPTMEKIQEVCVNEWILTHYKTLISMENSGCTWMFHNDRTEDLERMFLLFSRAPEALKQVRKVMMDCICQAGRDILNHPVKAKDPVSFISAILTLHRKYNHFVKESFKDNKEFQIALKQAFESCLNNDTRTAQHLSLYVDDMFRKGLKAMSNDTEIDESLDQIVTIFRFLQDKDVFEAFFRQQLSRRLLTGRCVSDEAETSMISKLKIECGHNYTLKLERMFQDMKLSQDITNAYLETSHPGNIELKVYVLTSGFWPHSLGTLGNLPLEVQECCNRFETFYHAKHTGRRLAWQPNHGSADVKAIMPKSRHELSVSTYQMCILLLFNNHPALSLSDIRQETNIPLDELKRHLMSLYVNPKAKILAKCESEKDKTKEPQDNDVFQVNSEFESKLLKIKVPLVQAKGSAEQDEHVIAIGGHGMGASPGSDMPSTISEDRKHLVEAAIVRVMKSRKSLDHNILVLEVIRHLSARFKPSAVLIKQRIEKLIECEYLERSPYDRGAYNYLA